VTITTSPTPVVEGAWLAPASHCNAMGQHAPSTRELDSDAIVRARVVSMRASRLLPRRVRS
jgi:ornithine cyclodeaminase/alanine dehydrogenase-like protein (mu-crystallin family)